MKSRPGVSATHPNQEPNAARSVLRRWYVVVLALCLAFPVVSYSKDQPGVYWTKFDVEFVLPPGATGPNAMRQDSRNIVFYAAMIEKQSNATRGNAAIRATSAPLYGTGIHSGYLVYLPNSGGQWQSNFEKAALTVEVVDESQEKLDAMSNKLVAQIKHDVLAPQEKLGVVPHARITTRVSPEHPETSYIPLRNKRAIATELLLGLVIGVTGAYYTDRIIIRIRRRKSPALAPRSGHLIQQRQTSRR